MRNAEGPRSLDDWLKWFETLHPKKIDLSLNRIATVLEALDILPARFHVVSIAGTNGKGSCVAYLSNIYMEAGYKVGSFTSPHLFCFNERISIDGVWASDRELVELFVAIEAARGKVTLSYFESSAVAAFLHFARNGVDIGVLEVGMGGRLDAVNIYDADAALIASIGLDHQEWLGADRELIGHEKAGIMRPGRPVVVGDPDPPASIDKHARAVRAEAYYVGRDFAAEQSGRAVLYTEGPGFSLEIPKPRFGGEEQLLNVAACLRLIRALEPVLPVSEDALRRGIEKTAPLGRMDVREIGGVEWIFDVAHNPAAMERLAEYLSGLAKAPCTWAVFGAMRDKDIPGVLELAAPFVDYWLVARVDSERAAETDSIGQELSKLGATSISCFDDVSSATSAALDSARIGDRVVVFGSFYIVGPAMSELGLYFDATSRA